MAKPTAEERETDSVYSCVCICTLHGVTAGRQQTLEIRGHHKIYLAFLSFCPFVSYPCKPLIPQPKQNCRNPCGEAWMLDSRVQQLQKYIEKGCGEGHSDGLCHRPGSGKLRIISCACNFSFFKKYH